MKSKIRPLLFTFLFWAFLALTIAFSEGAIESTSPWYVLRYPVYVICGIMGLWFITIASTVVYYLIFRDKETKAKPFFDKIARYDLFLNKKTWGDEG